MFQKIDFSLKHALCKRKSADWSFHFNSAQKLLFTILLQNICSELLGKTHIKALGIPYPFSKVAGSQLFAKKGRHCRCFPVSFAKKKKKNRSAAFYNMIGWLTLNITKANKITNKTRKLRKKNEHIVPISQVASKANQNSK